MSNEIKTDSLRPMSEIQVDQTHDFIQGLESWLESGGGTLWDMTEIGAVQRGKIKLTPELVVMYADGVEDFNPWYEGWNMHSWYKEGESPFGGAIVPPLLVSHFVMVAINNFPNPFPIGSVHTFHDSTVHAPIPVGATVEFVSKATDKFEKRGRRYVRHEFEVRSAGDEETLYFSEVRDTMSL